MADETYRPQKKSITPSDLNEAAKNQQELNEMAEIRQNIADQIENDTAGMSIKGNIPPQMRQLMDRDKGVSKQGPQPRNQSLRVTGSSRLEELIEGASSATAIYEKIVLPSRGKFYDGTDGPMDGIIHIRPMTGEEEQILATPRFVKKGQAINMIFNRCIQEHYDSENFITQDRTYLLIYLRGISYTTQYEVEVKCDECDRKFSTVIDLNALNLNLCPDSFSPAALSDKLPKTGYSFNYRIPRGKDEQEIQQHRDFILREFGSAGRADDTLLHRTALLLEDIEGLTDKEEIKQLLTKLPIQDVAYLRNTVNDLPFGVDTKVEIPCPYCLQDFDIEMPLETNFFFPRAKKKTQA